MNKFAKYVPEELKKLQREHIGAAAEGEGGSGGGNVLFSMSDTGFVCNVTYEKASEMLKNGAVALIVARMNTYELAASTIYTIATKIEWFEPANETPYIGFDFDRMNTKLILYGDNVVEMVD